MTTKSQSEVEVVTPYKAASIVNKVLEEKGIDKVVPAQMMYNYTTGRVRAGKNPLIETREVDGKVFITVDGLTAWIEKYVAKLTVTVEA